MLTECPHCLSKVIPMEDDTCPRCQKNTKDTAGTNPNLTTATFSHRDQLPSCCMMCGQTTDRVQKVVQQVREERAGGLLQVALRLFLKGWLAKQIESRMNSVVLSLPVCDRCKKTGARLKPRRFNAETLNMEFVVHKAFASKMKEKKANNIH